MLLREDMSAEGTLGGGCVEAEVRRRACELLRNEESLLATFQLDHDYGWEDGLICGGTMRVAIESICSSEQALAHVSAAERLERGEPATVPIRVKNGEAWEQYDLHIEAPARLIIAGAGHVGAEVARLAVGLDFDVTVVDDRSDFATPERLPPPIETATGDIEKVLREMGIDSNTFVVIVTRGHKHDEQALHAVIGSSARYIGMIGSRRKIKVIFDDLEALGVKKQEIKRVHAPIGLSIGAVTVPEIAISIVSQLVKVRRAQRPTQVLGPVTSEGESSIS